MMPGWRLLLRLRREIRTPAPTVTPGFLLLLALMAIPGQAAADPPKGEGCDKERAKDAFSQAIDPYGERQWEKAIPQLEKAADLCPSPGGPWLIPSPTKALVKYPYIPFFFLGKCYRGVQDFPTALRNFYLSGCVDEDGRHKENVSELPTFAKECRDRAVSKERPTSHPRFSEGFSARQEKKWEREAEKMWEALLIWNEDGKTTLSYGRWPVPYLPRFHLADALFHLGCYKEAAGQLDQSLLKTMQTSEVRSEQEQMSKLRPECERKIQEGKQEREVCQRWQCLLDQLRR